MLVCLNCKYAGCIFIHRRLILLTAWQLCGHSLTWWLFVACLGMSMSYIFIPIWPKRFLHLLTILNQVWTFLWNTDHQFLTIWNTVHSRGGTPGGSGNFKWLENFKWPHLPYSYGLIFKNPRYKSLTSWTIIHSWFFFKNSMDRFWSFWCSTLSEKNVEIMWTEIFVFST